MPINNGIASMGSLYREVYYYPGWIIVTTGLRRNICGGSGITRDACCSSACIARHLNADGDWSIYFIGRDEVLNRLEQMAGTTNLSFIEAVPMCLRLYVWDELVWTHPDGFPQGIENSYNHVVRVTKSAGSCAGNYPCYDDLNECWNVNGGSGNDEGGIAHLTFGCGSEPNWGVFSCPQFWQFVVGNPSTSFRMNKKRYRLAMLFDFYRWRARIGGRGGRRVYGGYNGANVEVYISHVR